MMAIKNQKSERQPSVLNGYFKRNFPDLLEGSDWIRNIPDDDRRALAHIGYLLSGLGSPRFQKKAGKARARDARRDEKGRFI